MHGKICPDAARGESFLPVGWLVRLVDVRGGSARWGGGAAQALPLALLALALAALRCPGVAALRARHLGARPDQGLGPSQALPGDERQMV